MKALARRNVLLGCLCIAGIVLVSFLFSRARNQIVYEEISAYGQERLIRIATPRNSHPDSEVRPVLVALHGALDTVEQLAEHSGLDDFAAEHDCVVIYLQGQNLNWPPYIPPENPDIVTADVEYFKAVIEYAVSELGGDRQRVFVVGVSQGGAMANLLTVKCSNLIAATVCNCGWLPKPLGEEPLGTLHKCPMLFISGTADSQVPTKMVRKGMTAFEAAGHPCKLELIQGAGHGWNDVNDLIWAFVKDKRLVSE